jgi:hypothetical protein
MTRNQQIGVTAFMTGLVALISSLIAQNMQVAKYVECLQDSLLLGDCSSQPINTASGFLMLIGIGLAIYGATSLLKSD